MVVVGEVRRRNASSVTAVALWREYRMHPVEVERSGAFVFPVNHPWSAAAARSRGPLPGHVLFFAGADLARGNTS